MFLTSLIYHINQVPLWETINLPSIRNSEAASAQNDEDYLGPEQQSGKSGRLKFRWLAATLEAGFTKL